MDELHSAKQAPHLGSSEDIGGLFRRPNDHTVAAAVALKPAIAQLEEAADKNRRCKQSLRRVRPARGAAEEEFDEPR